MLYTCADDFFDKASSIERLPVEDEMKYIRAMKEGDESAREVIVSSYLPFVAGYIKRTFRADKVSLELIYRCIDKLEEAICRYDISDRKAFSRQLSNQLKRTVTGYIAGI